ncbi:hypothetical protein LOCC1_G006052 [Lachnellula occidentalis]|uniref:Uncharacterized protein n=1 Tax=Lachnellula occidentalis TaxID=215460 RepID=A0A8H8UFH8_9HELO|nr:hypothetical protein LOCC1_G006052 [Lachnellula occidentalis]
MPIFSKVQAAFGNLRCHSSKRRPSTSSSDVEGGFEQMVHIYSCIPGSKAFKRGTVLIDPCNNGPNLITEEAILCVHAHPTGPGVKIKPYDGEERMIGGVVELCFSAPETGMIPRKRYYTRKFHCVPHITDGVDMILNNDFYMEAYADKVPGVLMIRSSQKKENKEEKRRREERERRQEENARRQDAERRARARAAEEGRQAQERACYYNSNNSTGGYSGSSGSYSNYSNGYSNS